MHKITFNMNLDLSLPIGGGGGHGGGEGRERGGGGRGGGSFPNVPQFKELYNLLKDHRNPYMQELVKGSYQHNYRDEFSSLLGMSLMDSQEVADCGTENVVRVTLLNSSFQPSLTNALSKMIEAKLQIDKFGFNVASVAILTSLGAEKHLSDKLTILVNDITIAMQTLYTLLVTEEAYTRGNSKRDRVTRTPTSAKQDRSSTPSRITSTSSLDSNEI